VRELALTHLREFESEGDPTPATSSLNGGGSTAPRPAAVRRNTPLLAVWGARVAIRPRAPSGGSAPPN